MSTVPPIQAYSTGSIYAVQLNADSAPLQQLGARMQQLNRNAHMNGYNWNAFLQHYLEVHEPALLRGLEADPDEESCVLLYEKDEQGQWNAVRLLELLRLLVADEALVCGFLEEEGGEVEWM